LKTWGTCERVAFSSFCTREPALGVGYDTEYRLRLETWRKSISTGVQYVSLDNKEKFKV